MNATRRCASCCRWPSSPVATRRSTSASAARDPRITRTWPAGCSIRASRACRSTRTRWSRPGCFSRSRPATASSPEATLGDTQELRREQPRAVVTQLADRLVDVSTGKVRALLDEALGDLRRPAARQLLQRAHVQVAIVEEALEVGHEARQEAPVLADAVA